MASRKSRAKPAKKEKASRRPKNYAWPEPERTRRQLSRAEIVEAALAVLKAQGFDGLTMRALAERLEIKAASLYNHVRDKDELLALMADAISADIPDPDPSKSWREQAEAIASDYRRVLMSYRDGARVLAATPPIGPNRIRMIEGVLQTLQKAGFPASMIVDASFVLNSYVVGFVLDEETGRPREPEALARRHEEAKRWFRALPKEQFPTLTALGDELIDAPSDRRFQTGLRALLDGFELQLGKARPGS